MPIITFGVSGSTQNMESFLKSLDKNDPSKVMHELGRQGVNALAANTPRDSGLAASSWDYKVEKDSGGVKVVWTNSDVEDGFPVVIALQYGYVTGTGGFVAGRDFINPAIKPIFDRIADKLWREVTNG